MTTQIRRISALFALVLIASAAVAAPPVKFWDTPTAACDHDKDLQRTLRVLQQHGFELQSEDEQAINYFVAPLGDHTWGTVEYTLTRSAGGYSLETDYAIVTAEITYYDGLGYRVTRISTEEYTVY